MTVHMVRLMIEPPKGEAQTAVDNWVQNHREWTDDPVDHRLVAANTAIDGTGTDYIRGDYRFIQEETADALLDDLESRLDSFQSGVWYRLGYHACTHDLDNPQPCHWDQTREGGTVPADVPEMA